MDGVESYVLDAGGSIFGSFDITGKCGFVLSDDLDLDLGDADLPLVSLSLGRTWLQGHSCISVIHHIIDSHIQ